MKGWRIVGLLLFNLYLASFWWSPAFADPILVASRNGDVDALAEALAEQPSVDPKSLERPLYFAAQLGHAEAVSMLLSHGANPNTVLDFGGALQKAARGNHVEALEALLNAGADPNNRDRDRELTALHSAAERGALEAAQLLLKHGADVNARNRWGLPPIHLAARKDRQEMIAFLSANGAAALPAAPISADELEVADLELGRISAIMCVQCHQVEPATTAIRNNSLGPSLTNVVGRDIGVVDGFRYSDSLKARGGSWTIQELNSFLTDPPGAIPGTEMEYPLNLTRKERVALIAYLVTLSENE